MSDPYGPGPLVHAATRFIPPRLREEYVLRAALVDRILSPDARLVVVTGPAGSGKSTLLAQAFAACPDGVWLSVESADDDPAVLWSALLDSTERVRPGFGESYRRRLDSGGGEAVDTLLPLFVNELADAAQPLRYFLDDLHLLSGERSIASLQSWLDHLPDGICLVIASREAPPFPLSRLRLERALVEIGASELAMDLDEARAALALAAIEPDEGQVRALLERTEGWVAGLAWATMAMQETPDTGSFMEAVEAIDGELTDYLVEEVLSQRPAELRAFMLETSILTRFNASLCDAVRNRRDSRTLLDQLDRTNSFLVPLDGHGEWYRYHHLVHDVLEARLRHTGPSSVPILHERASSWLGEHGEVVESIRHARAAGAQRRAAGILCAHWWEMMNGGRIETAYALFEEFEHAEIAGYQPLAIAAALLYSLAGDHERGEVYFRAAEAGHVDGPPPDGSASVASSLAIMRGAVALGGVDAVFGNGRVACELEPADSPWRPLAVLLVALGHIWRGELDEAEPFLDEVILAGTGNESLVVYGLAERALIRLGRSDVQGALSAARAACDRSSDAGLETVLVTAVAHGAAALAELAAGDLPAADRHLDAAQVPMAAVASAMPMDAMHTRILLADVAVQLGRIEEAREHTDAAAAIANRYTDTGVLAEQCVAIRERLEDASSGSPVELSEREQAVLALLPSELSIREIADALYVSKDTVTTHRRHIYQKLGVTSRADAVVAARLAGLLPVAADGAGPSEEVDARADAGVATGGPSSP